MKLEIINRVGKLVHTIKYKESLPPKTHINSMLNAGYKFKLNGKIASKKALLELYKEGAIKND